MKSLTIILLSHDRPLLAKQAIQSILAQTEKNFRLVVSDNSTSHELSLIMKEEFSTVEYISWFPGVSASEHFENARKLVLSPYFVLFHDDDLLERDYVENILRQFQIFPKAAAIGTNGYFINQSGSLAKSSFIYESNNEIDYITGRAKLLTRYLTAGAGGVAPFSSYAYNTELVRDFPLNFDRGQNYFDTIYLSDIASVSLIVWINKPLVKVRIDHDRLSIRSGVKDYKAFIALVQQNYTTGVKQYHIDEYRLVHLFFEMKKRRRYSIAYLRYLIINIPRLMVISVNFRKRAIKYLFNWLLTK